MGKSKLIGKSILLGVMILLLMGNAGAASQKIFSDVQKGHWAESYIVRMNLKGIIKGYADGTYGINKPVSRLETVTMIIRTMGLEAQAEGKTVPTTFKDQAPIPQWGEKYVAMGVIQGVITGSDLYSFRSGENAKRFEVAQFIGKAMGLELSAPSHVSDPLPYTDAFDIPLSARGYVALLRAKGIMMGNSDGTFKPLQDVTRAEVAALMARLDSYLKRLPENEIRGTVVQTLNSTITVNTTDGAGNLYVPPDAFIFAGGQETSLESIAPGTQVLVIKDGTRALYIEVEEEAETTSMEGVIKEIKDSGRTLVVTVGTVDRTLSLPETALIKVDGVIRSASSLALGQQVQIEAAGNTALTVDAENEEESLSGKVVSLEFSPEVMITVEDQDGVVRSFKILPDCTVRRNGSRVSLQAVVSGDEVELEVSNGWVTDLDADAVNGEITGTVKQVVLAREITITITDEEGNDRTYVVNSDTRIKKNDAYVTLLDVKPGDYAELRLESNVVTRIYIEAKTVKEQITGDVTTVNTDLNLLVVEVAQNENRESYTVLADSDTTIVTIEGKVSSRLSKVSEGDRVIVVGDFQDHVLTATTILIVSTRE